MPEYPGLGRPFSLWMVRGIRITDFCYPNIYRLGSVSTLNRRLPATASASKGLHPPRHQALDTSLPCTRLAGAEGLDFGVAKAIHLSGSPI